MIFYSFFAILIVCKMHTYRLYIWTRIHVEALQIYWKILILLTEPTIWSSWSECNATCGGGTRTRNTICVDIETTECRKVTEAQDCNTSPCPIDGVTEWMSWESCNASCGTTGTQLRRIRCHQPRFGGSNCTHVHGFEEFRSCNRYEDYYVHVCRQLLHIHPYTSQTTLATLITLEYYIT